MAASIPVFVEGLDRVRGGVREAHPARDARAPVAANVDHLACRAGLAREIEQQREARPDRAPVSNDAERRDREADAVLPVDQLERAFDREVVGPEERGDAGGVVGAASVLEQQRVVEGRAFLGAEAESFGEAHADGA